MGVGTPGTRWREVVVVLVWVQPDSDGSEATNGGQSSVGGDATIDEDGLVARSSISRRTFGGGSGERATTTLAGRKHQTRIQAARGKTCNAGSLRGGGDRGEAAPVGPGRAQAVDEHVRAPGSAGHTGRVHAQLSISNQAHDVRWVPSRGSDLSPTWSRPD